MWTCRRLTPLRRAVALNACSACSSSSPISRGFLSDSFSCPGPWESRLKSPLVAKIDPATFFYDVEKKFSRENRGSAIDIDLFAQKAQSNNLFSFINSLV